MALLLTLILLTLFIILININGDIIINIIIFSHTIQQKVISFLTCMEEKLYFNGNIPIQIQNLFYKG